MRLARVATGASVGPRERCPAPGLWRSQWQVQRANVVTGFRLRCPVPVFIYDPIPTGTIDKIDDEPIEETRFQSDTYFKVGDVVPSTLVRPGTWTIEWLQDLGETEWAESPTPGTIRSRRLYCRVDP